MIDTLMINDTINNEVLELVSGGMKSTYLDKENSPELMTC